MPPTARHIGPHSSRLVYALFSLISGGLSHLRGTVGQFPEGVHRHVKRAPTTEQVERILFPILIPVLVLLSGLFAGLTLGYMSLDQTQLNVLRVSGTPDQRKYASKIAPIRKNGHLLLVTLLLANMIVNETLPIISTNPLGGGIPSVIVSTALIVIFSEIIPQSLFTRYGLYLGAFWATPTKFLIYGLGIVSWPTAKLLDWVVGHNMGVIYRRVELKELILMHSSSSPHGGDLNHDTAAIIGATLDLQDKIVAQAMTPLSDVFMIHIDAKLDFALLKKIVESGHSRIPVYEKVDVKLGSQEPKQEIKIIGILLVKQCVLLDPKDATPVRHLQLNKVPFIPQNETLLGILDKFQEGRSHIAIVSRFSVEKAKSVKKVVKQTLTQRLKERVGMDSDSETSSSDTDSEGEGSSTKKRSFRKRFSRKDKHNKDKDEEVDTLPGDPSELSEPEQVEMQTIKPPGAFGISNLEANMPADAVLTEHGAAELLLSLDPAIMPLGIITLEDVLEELIGEEIYDEFDSEGARGEPLQVHTVATTPAAAPIAPSPMLGPLANVRNLHFFRSLSAPPIKRDPLSEKDALETSTGPTDTGNGPLPNTAIPPAPEVVAPAAIEAKLLDHKRRKIMSSAQTGAVVSTEGKAVSGVPGRPRPGPKGKFKSGPIKKSAVTAKMEPPTASTSIPEVHIEPPSATAMTSEHNVREQSETGDDDEQ